MIFNAIQDLNTGHYTSLIFSVAFSQTVKIVITFVLHYVAVLKELENTQGYVGAMTCSILTYTNNIENTILDSNS